MYYRTLMVVPGMKKKNKSISNQSRYTSSLEGRKVVSLGKYRTYLTFFLVWFAHRYKNILSCKIPVTTTPKNKTKNDTSTPIPRARLGMTPPPSPPKTGRMTPAPVHFY